jgi:hypothetical protein
LENDDSRDEADAIFKNFSFHIARVIPTIYYNKVAYDENEIASIDTEIIHDQIILDAFEKLIKFAGIYGAKYPKENIINVSKSKKFVIELDEYLKNNL